MGNKNAKYYRQLFIDNLQVHIDEYIKGKTIKDIASDNFVDHRFVSDVFVKAGIKNKGRRKYSLNEHYFDIIDDQKKAYYLGLLYADGCNHIDRYAIHLDLQEDDKEILEQFKKDIGSNRPLRKVEKKDSYINGRLIKGDNCKSQICLELSSKHLSLTLNNMGLTKQKSLTLSFPNLSESLVSHFIRGYFDGDGSLYSFCDQKIIRYGFSIISTNEFCNKVKDIIKSQLGINLNLTIAHPENNNITSVLKTLDRYSIKKILDWLYMDADVFLKRKHDRYILYFYNEQNNSLSA